MKKSLTGAIIGLLLLPQVSFAQSDAVGMEFLSPLVQTIITLLHDRIAELTAEVAFLRSNTVSCEPLGATLTPQQKVDTLNAQEANRIRAEFAQRYLEIDQQIADLIAERDFELSELDRTYNGATEGLNKAKNEVINATKIKINTLQTEKDNVKLEERRQLASVGVY